MQETRGLLHSIKQHQKLAITVSSNGNHTLNSDLVEKLQQKRLEKAKELLSTTSLDVIQIAYMLGYEYSQSFSKFF